MMGNKHSPNLTPSGSSSPEHSEEVRMQQSSLTTISPYLQLQKPLPYHNHSTPCQPPLCCTTKHVPVYIHKYVLLSFLLLPSMPEKTTKRSMQSTAASSMGCLEPSQCPCPALLASLQGAHFPSRFMAPNCSTVLCLL